MHVNITTLAPLLLLIPVGGVMAMTYYKRHKVYQTIKNFMVDAGHQFTFDCHELVWNDHCTFREARRDYFLVDRLRV